ncbi:MerR family transcriptional regulator [Amnibacterium flavum]|uniref:MerR family transcriptional regulator n=1 Tax=Amnibacterium flavum TaxID=2173173 RepID=A0A2V1HMN3_9MICO|nr:MerR family transcriptional regulator [Amnibacterium flavum]PVZ93798.1 MerR family transcriptional regulator [Amnibacterium flavum]
MPWSTRELADLAGTTVNTVRHYHRTGLLAEPDRMSNGYKQYQVRHLVRLLQIRRLRELGVPLEQIEQVGASGDASADALRAIDADLGASIERLQRARAEIRAILEGSSVAGVPAGFENVAARLSKPEQSLMLIYAQLYDDEAMGDLRQMIADDPVEVTTAFEDLRPDADDTERQQLAERYAPLLARHLSAYPWLSDPTAHLIKAPGVTQNTFLESVAALYTPAQLDVIVRASAIAREMVEATGSPTADPTA